MVKAEGRAKALLFFHIFPAACPTNGCSHLRAGNKQMFCQILETIFFQKSE
jgi:hypothetical protein